MVLGETGSGFRLREGFSSFIFYVNPETFYRTLITSITSLIVKVAVSSPPGGNLLVWGGGG